MNLTPNAIDCHTKEAVPCIPEAPPRWLCAPTQTGLPPRAVTTLQTTQAGPPAPDQLWREVFTPSSDHLALPFSLDGAELAFGAVPRAREGRVVHVRNSTAAKARAVWCLPSDGSVWAVPPGPSYVFVSGCKCRYRWCFSVVIVSFMCKLCKFEAC